MNMQCKCVFKIYFTIVITTDLEEKRIRYVIVQVNTI